MSDYPAGVITAQVALSTAAFDAKTLGGQWVVTANQSLVYGGQPVLLRPLKVPAGDNPADLLVVLPVSAQSGFVSATTGLPVNPTYTATYQPITAPILTSVPFTVVAGETTKVAPLLNVLFWPYATSVSTGVGGVAAGTWFDTGGGLFAFIPTGGTTPTLAVTATATATALSHTVRAGARTVAVSATATASTIAPTATGSAGTGVYASVYATTY
jgi:hypothetical protein